jgi:hypothetical protein
MKRSSVILFICIVASLFSAPLLEAQSTTSEFWQEVSEPQAVARLTVAQRSTGKREIVPVAYRTLALQKSAMQTALNRAPRESTQAQVNDGVEISLPLPDGGYGRFRVWNSPIMEDGLAARFPELKTYAAQGIDDPTASGRLDMSPRGLRAMIQAEKGSFFIDPYWSNSDAVSISYYEKDFVDSEKRKALTCGVVGKEAASPPAQHRPASLRPTGANLKTYRLAVAATGEYSVAVAGSSPTKPNVLAAMVTSVNRVTAVYEREFAIRLILVSNNDLLIFLNGSTDPYTNNDGEAMLGQNQTRVDSVIGDANYDIGHVFSTGGGGIAGLGVVGVTGEKAFGVTGSPNPTGDPYDIDYVAHEIGHQFGGNHTFNGTSGSAAGNRNGPTAYEPGSASTIMGYAGICAPQDLQRNSDDYFHSASYTEIDNYTTTGAGRFPFSSPATGNQVPVIASLPTTVTNIPSQTPFALTASATDGNGDALTYCWEEFDIGVARNPISTPRDNGSSPIFRSYDPTANPTRVFPSLQYILNNANVPPATYTGTGGPFATGEFLPTTTRTMTFRVSVRDNRAGGGGQNWASMQVRSNSTAGPFVITSQNTAGSLNASSPLTVNWNVANTTASPINCANVKISYSTDGGTTFPVVLASSVPNNGSAIVNIPNIGASATTTGRIKVESVGNIFFDINNANLNVTATNAAPTIAGFTPTSGVQNTTVVLTGTDFLSATGVSFNGTPATNFTINSGTQITAKVPASATTGPITVTNSVGPGSSLTNFTVVPGPPAPDVVGFSPAFGIGGESVVITGSSFTNVLTVSFNGANASYLVDSATQITATVPAGTSSGVIAVTTTSGTGSSATSFGFLSGTGAPVVTSFSPGSGPPSSIVVLTGKNFAAVTSVSFNGLPATFTADSLTQITATVPASASTGVIGVTNAFGSGTSSSSFTVTEPPLGEPVIISQIYGGGGNSGASYRNDYVELYNRDTRVISLATWSIQYASASGNSWTVVNLSGSIQPGKYYLVSLASGGTAGASLPAPDATGAGLNISASAGKIVLVNSTTAITSGTTNPSGTTGLQDFVGYGTANASETATAPAGSNTLALFRAGSGATDTGDNSADFSSGTPNARNSSFGSGTAPVITSALTASGTVGIGVSYQITASNTPTGFSATGLPSGLTVSATGLISGTPSTAGVSNIQLGATNASGTGNATLVLTVTPGGVAPVITSATTLAGTIGVAIAPYQIAASNGPTSFSAVGLPANLSMNSAGLITGTPSVSGTFQVTLGATNSTGTGTANLAITIAPGGGAGATALLAGWDFQTTAGGGTAVIASPNTPTSFAANVGSGNLYLNGTNGSSTWLTATELAAFGGTEVNAGGSTGLITTTTSPASLALLGGSSNAANGKKLIMKFSMTGYQNLVVSYAHQRTGTGFTSMLWETSLDGTAWVSAQTITAIPGSFALQTLNPITSLDGAATAYLRITCTGATGASGNVRLDNIQLNATSSATPPNVVLTGNGTGLVATFGSAGTPSSALTVSGSNLTADITVTAPSGFEISKTEGGTYATNQTFAQSAGTVASSPLFVRVSSGPNAGIIGGTLVAVSSTAGAQISLGGIVSKASLTPVFAGDSNPTYNGNPKALTATTTPATAVALSYQGTGTTVYDSSTSPPTDAGTYSVTATISDTNYEGSSSASLTIGKASQVITFSPLPTKSVGDAPFSLTAIGGASAQAITYTSSDLDVAQVFDGTVAIVGAGQTTITANQAGNDNFTAAPPVDQVLTVTSGTGPTFSSTFPGSAPTDIVGGIPALVAYGLGGAPTGNNLPFLPVGSYSADTLQITFIARTNDPSITINVEGSSNLSNPWNAAVSQLGGVSQAGVPSGFERQVWTLSLPGKGFMRVKVVQSP